MSFLAEKVIVGLIPRAGGEAMSDEGELVRPLGLIDLAREAEFTLGPAHVRPSLCDVLIDGDAVRLQPRVMQVLVALHQAAGEVVSREELTARCWGGLTVGEDSITRCIAALRRLSETEAAGAFTLETLPRVGYRLMTAATAEAVERDVAPPLSSRRRGFPAWLIAGAVAAVSLVGGGAWLAGFLQPARADIALIPFATAGDADARTMSLALPDMLANLYAKADIKTLALPAGSPNNARRAQFLVRGEVEGAGGVLNATVVVSDPARDAVLWSAEFSRPRGEMRALERQIAGLTAVVSWCALDLVKRAPRDAGADLVKAAFLACDRDLDFLASIDSGDRARVAMADVVVRYPDYAPGLAIMADLDSTLAERQPPAAAAATRAAGRALAARALKLDPHCGRAWLALVQMIPWSPPPLAAYGILASGLAASPDDGLLRAKMAEVMGGAGYDGDAVGEAVRAQALRPLDPSMAMQLATAMAFRGNVGGARQLFDMALARWPGDDDLSVGVMAVEAREGDPDRALALASQATKQGLPWYAPVFAERMRRMATVRKAPTPGAIGKAAEATLADYRNQKITAGQAVLDLASLSAVDQTFALAATLPPKDIDTSAFFRPFAGPVRADKRFMPLAARLGLVAFWRARGRWPDFCQPPGAPYDCAQAAKGL